MAIATTVRTGVVSANVAGGVTKAIRTIAALFRGNRRAGDVRKSPRVDTGGKGRFSAGQRFLTANRQSHLMRICNGAESLDQRALGVGVRIFPAKFSF